MAAKIVTASSMNDIPKAIFFAFSLPENKNRMEASKGKNKINIVIILIYVYVCLFNTPFSSNEIK